MQVIILAVAVALFIYGVTSSKLSTLKSLYLIGLACLVFFLGLDMKGACGSIEGPYKPWGSIYLIYLGTPVFFKGCFIVANALHRVKPTINARRTGFAIAFVIAACFYLLMALASAYPQCLKYSLLGKKECLIKALSPLHYPF